MQTGDLYSSSTSFSCDNENGKKINNEELASNRMKSVTRWKKYLILICAIFVLTKYFIVAFKHLQESKEIFWI